MKLIPNRKCTYPFDSERGIVLFTVLIALIVISLSAVALVRSVDTGTVIAGNLAFRQATTHAADAGTEAALAWIKEKAAADVKTLYESDVEKGYYATWMSACDLTGNRTPAVLTDDVDWGDSDVEEGGSCMKASDVTGGLPDGYTAAYVINRLCGQEGEPSGIACERYSNSTATAEAGVSMAGPNYAAKGTAGTTQYFYRVTTRVAGPRNTVSIVQSVLLN